MSSKPTLLGPNGQALPQGIGRLVRQAAATQASPFRGGDRESRNLSSWQPALRSPDAESRFTRDTVVARSRDLYRNSPIARAGVDTSVSRGIGAEYRLRAKPHYRALGISFEDSVKLAEQMETAWALWFHDIHRRCDAQRKRSGIQLLRLLWKSKCIDGEHLAVLRWRPENGGPFATCVQVVDTDRLINRNRVADTELLRQGVHFDTFGAPIAYDILNAHPNDFYATRNANTWVTAPKRDAYGRPVVIHGFTEDRPDQTRGVSPFAPILELFHMTDRYWDSAVQHAIITGTIGTFIRSGFDPAAVAASLSTAADIGDSVSSWQDTRIDFYDDFPVYLGDKRLPIVAPGDDIVFASAGKDTGPNPEFVKIAYQTTAAALGQAYPELAQNWEGVSYSSARTAYNSVWQRVVVDRSDFEDDAIDPIYYAVMEEAFERGYIDIPEGAPDFHEAATAYLQASWTGPGREHVDPLKGVQADEAEIDARLATHEAQSARRGRDWREDFEQLARENAYAAELLLPPRNPEKALALESPTDEEARLGSQR